jgi:hypothetical protein
MNRNAWFVDRTGVLATMHQKERVIAPLFATELGLTVTVPTEFDTDCFGTFTRDVERPGTQLEAARIKARAALEMTGAEIAIASEGAFFSHPFAPYVACDRELILLMDQTHSLEIVAEELSIQTNYAHQSIKTLEEAWAFAQKIGFPEHALVVMPCKDTQDKQDIFKGITCSKVLTETVELLLQQSSTGTVHLETDMRAMFNPTRMRAIEQVTQNLIAKLKRHCPGCDCPGFDVVEYQKGLPCSLCHWPTEMIRAEIYQCQKCSYKQEKLLPQGLEFADPGQCSYCNP